MEQLTIKHLGRRLAYGLQVNIGKMPECYQLEMTAEDEWDSASISITDTLENGHKPILRPLSDLTKEITHNGKTFVPIERIKELTHEDVFVGPFGVSVDNGFAMGYNINCVQSIFNLLLEWHFHIDEPEGTWIDVNTLTENPYK